MQGQGPLPTATLPICSLVSATVPGELATGPVLCLLLWHLHWGKEKGEFRGHVCGTHSHCWHTSSGWFRSFRCRSLMRYSTMFTLLLWAAKWRAFIPSWRQQGRGRYLHRNLRMYPHCVNEVRVMSRKDTNSYLVFGSLVCSSFNQHEHDLEASRPGCKVKYCQAVLRQEERREESIMWMGHSILCQPTKAYLVIHY
jgi:hypothetical protein